VAWPIPFKWKPHIFIVGYLFNDFSEMVLTDDCQDTALSGTEINPVERPGAKACTESRLIS